MLVLLLSLVHHNSKAIVVNAAIIEIVQMYVISLY
jgi:hypothetical protein